MEYVGRGWGPKHRGKLTKLWVSLRTRRRHSPYPRQCDACSFYYVTCRTCEFR